jgi:hypothetical protein
MAPPRRSPETSPVGTVSPDAPASPASASPAATTSPTHPRASSDFHGLLPKRGGISRSTAGKTFQLVDGEWVDMAYHAAAGRPVVEVRSPAERAALVERLPALAPYDALGARVLVVLDGTVYRLSRPGSP